MFSRRDILKSGIAAGVAANLPVGWVIRSAGAMPACDALGCSNGMLADPGWQFFDFGAGPAAFTTPVPNALDPGFLYALGPGGEYNVGVGIAQHSAGIVDTFGAPQPTMTIYGYGDQRGPTWPGRTFEIVGGVDNETKTKVRWLNNLTAGEHLLPVDTSLHWCYSLHGYTQHTIATAGVPIITHLHGGHTDFQFDGNPEFFYNSDQTVIGPSWNNVPGGFTDRFKYDNNVMAGTLWYHDHALGITRLNVYAGMAGFYIVRDAFDTGLVGNALDLPSRTYERAYAIQDRMFTAGGQLFVPALPGDPYYADFITGEDAILPTDIFPGGGPTAMAEFFGDHMIVNGKAWPVEAVEQCNYRLRLLNGTDSRFMAFEFYEVPAGATDPAAAINGPLGFTVVGSDQGIASAPTTVTRLVCEPGSRYDIVFDFKQAALGNRVIMKNVGGDEPFGGAIPGPQVFEYTDRIMAFDVGPYTGAAPDVTPVGSVTAAFGYNAVPPQPVGRIRKVALFEGKDEFGRLQPLLGTAEPATDWRGRPINWPATPEYEQAMLPNGTSAPLTGQMSGSIAWHSPTTENPKKNTTEEWEVWNVTGDAHPAHLHLVNFEIVGRKAILWDSNTVSAGDVLLDGTIATEDDETRVIPNAKALLPLGDGTYLEVQPTVQHNSVAGDATTYGQGFRIMTPTASLTVEPASTRPGYVENAPKDMVTALPDEVTILRAKFDKNGRYVWHCHILSHEDHEMMRVLHVGPGA